VTAADSLWLGPVHSEARAAFQRARNAGLSPLRALVIGSIASFKECWTFRRNLAAKVGCSVRTVQRALTQARAEGLIGVARAKPNETPPGWQHGPVTCGWSHRWVIGWGQAGQRVADAVHAAKARWLVKHAAPRRVEQAPSGKPAPSGATNSTVARPEYQRRTWTSDELDAELERLERLKKPPPT
jgi:DNA-binding transcriptional MocR family regulator